MTKLHLGLGCVCHDEELVTPPYYIDNGRSLTVLELRNGIIRFVFKNN